MTATKYYDCFPEYIYNTAFGSLLSGPNCIESEESAVNNGLCSENLFKEIPGKTDDHCVSSAQLYNNSAWKDDCNSKQQQQSVQDIIKILIDFLDEFLIFLSSIIQCEKFQPRYQLQKMIDVAERIYQLRSTILIQINNIHGHMTNSTILDIPSISLLLHELASIIYCLSKNQQQTGTTIEHPEIIMFSQSLDRLGEIIKSCMDCVSMHSNPQNSHPSIPGLFSCINSHHVIDNSTSSTACLFPCNGPNMYMPWSILEQRKNSSETDPIFGLMYGIKDAKVRRKLGYGIGEHQSPNRAKQKYRRNIPLNKEANFDGIHQRIASSSDNQIPMLQQTSVVSNKENLKITESKEINKKSGRISQKENGTNKHNDSRTISQQQSIVNSKQSSPLFNSNSDADESTRLRSIHDRLIVSNSSGRMTPSYIEESPITSMADHSESQRTPSRLVQQQQSNIYKEDKSKSTLSSPVSFQTYGYGTPSKTTYTMSHESGQNLSPVHNKSINTQQSRKNSSINDIKETKSTSRVVKNGGKQSFKETINQNPISYQTHIDSADSSVTLTSNDKIQHSDNISNKSWEQRLASPVSMTSVQRSPNTHLQQNIISPIVNKQRSINETTSDFNFDKYSEHQMSPSINFVVETNDNISSLNIIKGPQSAEGEKKPLNISDNNQKYMSTPSFSPINTHRQRSTSATSDSDDSSDDPKTKEHENAKHSSRFIREKPIRRPLQSNKQGYLNKFINCFRRTIVNRVDQLNYKNK